MDKKISNVDNYSTNIDNHINDIAARIDIVNEKIKQVEQNIKKQNDLLQNIEAQNRIYFNLLYKKGNESIENAKKRFFLEIPQATGDLRVIQQGNANILAEFSKICRENNLPFWIEFGTLLGAVRHKGTIPWDDDIDVGMFRDDINKLQKILKNDKDFKITIVFDYYVHCRQIRFCTTNINNPCFIDIFIYEPCDDYSDQKWQEMRHAKEYGINKINNYNKNITEFWKNHPCLPLDTAEGRKIDLIFQKFFPIQKSKHPNPTAIAFSLENLFISEFNHLYKWNDIFPTKTLIFEGKKYPVPNQYEKILKRQYGDFYELPKDLTTHFQHIDYDQRHIDAIKNFIK